MRRNRDLNRAVLVWSLALVVGSLAVCGGTYNVQGDAYVHHVLEVNTAFIERLCEGQPTPQLRANCEADLYEQLLETMDAQAAKNGGGH